MSTYYIGPKTPLAHTYIYAKIVYIPKAQVPILRGRRGEGGGNKAGLLLNFASLSVKFNILALLLLNR